MLYYSCLSGWRKSYLTPLRYACVSLQIQVRRWTNKCEQERFCLACNDGLVESENHFVFDSSYYTVERQQLYGYT